MVVVPFAVVLIRLALAPGQHVYLPDDLALIDLHTRRALQWKQQLGVFDHNGWNHPGPAYFYLLSLVYRVLGSGAKAMFVGATLINALAAVACVSVARRRSTPARALWTALWVCVLASLLATVGPGSITYSEGALGGLVSPWNPMVVIFPLLLFILLCAAAIDRSPLSLIGALLVGSFIVQTNISALILVAAVFVVTLATWVVTVVADRRDEEPASGGVAASDGRPSPSAGVSPSRRGWWWGTAGAVVFVLMWLPTVVQQLTNHPGNLTLIYRFFTAPHPVPSLAASLRSVVSVYGVLLVGPSEVMSSYLGHTPNHLTAAVTATVVATAVGVAVTVVGARQRNRFAVALGGLSLVGLVAMVVAVSRVVGDVYGYLVVWAIAVPISALIGAGMVRWSLLTAAQRPFTSLPQVRMVGCVVGVVASVVLCVRVVAIPSLASASDPQVGLLGSLVLPSLGSKGPVFVNDGGAGTDPASRLLDVEKFVGLVNLLDQEGYQPTVNRFWSTQFGPGFEASGKERRAIELDTWTPSSPHRPGYVGRVGDLAVTLITSSHDPADSPG
jgi:hypothetical protein